MRKRPGLSYRCRRIRRIYPDVAEAQVEVIDRVGSVHSDYNQRSTL
jgi:hypothetical protein